MAEPPTTTSCGTGCHASTMSSTSSSRARLTWWPGSASSGDAVARARSSSAAEPRLPSGARPPTWAIAPAVPVERGGQRRGPAVDQGVPELDRHVVQALDQDVDVAAAREAGALGVVVRHVERQRRHRARRVGQQVRRRRGELRVEGTAEQRAGREAGLVDQEDLVGDARAQPGRLGHPDQRGAPALLHPRAGDGGVTLHRLRPGGRGRGRSRAVGSRSCPRRSRGPWRRGRSARPGTRP